MRDKQRVFIDEYLKDFNATQAAIRTGYSANTAYSSGQRMLKNVEIQTEIQRLISERAMGKDEVLQRLADQARGDIADLMDITPTGFTFRLVETDAEGNRVINPKTKLIKKIRQRVTTILSKQESAEDKEIIDTEIELYDAQDALALLGKYHRLFVDRTSVEDPDGRPLLSGLTDVAEALRRAYPTEEGKDAATP